MARFVGRVPARVCTPCVRVTFTGSARVWGVCVRGIRSRGPPASEKRSVCVLARIQAVSFCNLVTNS